MKNFIIISAFFTLIYLHGQAQAEQQKPWSLEECIEYAVTNNITVKDAELTKGNNELNYAASKSSRLPNLTGSASQNISFGTAINNITSDYISQTTNSTSLGLSTSVTLYNGNQINNKIKQNKLLVDQSSLYIKEAENSITLSVTEAYIQVLYNKENILIATTNLETSEKELEMAKARLEAGTISMVDYTDAQSQTATNKYNLIAAKNNYQQQLLVLKQLLELPPEESFEIETFKNYEELLMLPDKMEIYQKALAVLPEIEADKVGVDISKKDLEIAKGAFLPTLSLTGSIGSGYTDIQDMSFSDQLDFNFNQRVGLSLSIPIFNRNQTKTQVKSAKINIKKAELQLQSTQKELYKKIETAWHNAVSSHEQLSASISARDASKESYTLAQKKYELNALSTTDLIISQNAYTNAEINYLQAKYLNILYVQLLQFYQGNPIKID
ncbi:TolC family protein [Abyssalbus ytuae]|uniref:TolC family protein n=1 Tax=Abyssalbus ytuae TaxID=2926907 RepID=A0A9E6ZQR8_9FLAO|nr:TolC family protein [Abyssalbus ytuae]UOB18770.1 TolC family protein [Abyssalbus ytuae]